jgi:hypothetical protein
MSEAPIVGLSVDHTLTLSEEVAITASPEPPRQSLRQALDEREVVADVEPLGLVKDEGIGDRFEGGADGIEMIRDDPAPSFRVCPGTSCGIA